MKKKHLEIFLQKIPVHPNPKYELEQYSTPAIIAADIIYNAYQIGDIENKEILDLGCGTGIFSIAAATMNAKKVIGVDIDKKSIEIAKKQAEKNNLAIKFINKDISKINIKADTVIMNPPFGAQRSNRKADRKFLEKANESAKIIYTLHLKKTDEFIEQITKSMNTAIDFKKTYEFPIKARYSFHEKKINRIQVNFYRMITKR
ncbi:MAG: METTL5 family protein [Candidatus Thermoplasmatota archaeon]